MRFPVDFSVISINSTARYSRADIPSRQQHQWETSAPSHLEKCVAWDKRHSRKDSFASLFLLTRQHNSSFCSRLIKSHPNTQQIPHNQAKYSKSSGMMATPSEILSELVLSAQLRWFSPTCPCGGEPRPWCNSFRSRSNRANVAIEIAPRSTRSGAAAPSFHRSIRRTWRKRTRAFLLEDGPSALAEA